MAQTLDQAEAALKAADAAATEARSAVLRRERQLNLALESPPSTDPAVLADTAERRKRLADAQAELQRANAAFDAAQQNWKQVYENTGNEELISENRNPETGALVIDIEGVGSETENDEIDTQPPNNGLTAPPVAANAPNDPATDGAPPVNTGLSPSPDAALEQAVGPQAENFESSPLSVDSDAQLSPYGEENDPLDPQSAKTLDDTTIVDTEDPQLSPFGEENDPLDLEGEEGEIIAAPDAIVSPVTSDSNTTITNALEDASTPKFPPPPDFRVRISLAPGSKYFYNTETPGILSPLKRTNGVIFPYTPAISVTYAANYDSYDLTHSNYKSYTYRNSSVDQVSIIADFTAQTTEEANYVLAVIHFFRSASKMFYGQDLDPVRGTPPPVLYLSGYGAYQFDNHPLVLSSFAYALPTDVDYISASITTDKAGLPTIAALSPNTQLASSVTAIKKQNPIETFRGSLERLTGSGLRPGGKPSAPVFTSSASIKDATRVPTKIQVQLTFLPIITRNAISNKFSLQSYATGSLLRGSRNAGTGGGIW